MHPNFIIPGAQKSGTTALRIYLAQHHGIFMVNKEIHFFDNDKNFEKGKKWYENFFKDWSNQKAVGEKTTEYLYCEKAPRRIYNLFPDVKLIFIFRNPVDRAYSHYWHNVRNGREILNFEKAIEIEEERVKIPEYNALFSYKNRGKYILQIKRYAKYFPKSKMLFVLAENLKDDREVTLQKILEFLEVETNFEFKNLEEKNIGGIPRSKLLVKITGNKKIRKVRILRDIILKINTKKGEIPPMNSETRQYLLEYFEKYNKELEKFTGMDIGRWE